MATAFKPRTITRNCVVENIRASPAVCLG
jgi:hypothetical protein